MKRIIILIMTSFSFLSFILPQDKWIMVWNEEFNGTSLDLNKWQYSRDIARWRKYNDAVFQLNNLSVENGLLKIINKKEKITTKAIWWLPDDTVFTDGKPNLREFDYTGGEISSWQLFTEGYFEIRCKFAGGKGIASAFWLYGYEGDEIDVFEADGSLTNKFQANIHCKSGCKGNEKDIIVSDVDFTSEFHVFACKWDGYTVIFYVDGVAKYLIYKKFDRGQKIIIGSIKGSIYYDDPPDEVFPSIMYIDYVRVYKKIDCDENISICNYQQDNYNYSVLTGNKIELGGEPDCDYTVYYRCNYPDPSAYCWSERQGYFLDMVATEKISLKPGFKVEKGAYLTGKIVDCSETILKSAENEIISKEFIENKKPDEIIIYPNPSNGKLYISGNITGNINIKIFDLNSRIIFHETKNSENPEIDISKLPNGIYFIQLKSSDINYYDKLIISHK